MSTTWPREDIRILVTVKLLLRTPPSRALRTTSDCSWEWFFDLVNSTGTVTLSFFLPFTWVVRKKKKKLRDWDQAGYNWYMPRTYRRRGHVAPAYQQNQYSSELILSFSNFGLLGSNAHYSGTLLNRHPSTVDTHNITDNFESPDRFSIDFNTLKTPE